MVLDVALCVRCARIDGTWIDASTIQASHVRRTLRVALAYRADLLVHCKSNAIRSFIQQSRQTDFVNDIVF